MLSIMRFLWGYISFTVAGTFPERFMNLITKKGIRIFNIKKNEGILYCSTIVSEYKLLKELAKKSSIKIELKEKKGLPFLLEKYKKRKGIFVGVLCFYFILHFLSLYIWSININNNNLIDQIELNNFINSLGINTGTLKSNVDTSFIEKSIMNKFTNISWVSANIRGSALNLELKERINPPDLVPKEDPCNIKSNATGQILRLEVYSGTPEVKIGDAVAENQLLVSGICEDDFGMCRICHADAKVFALTKHTIRKEIDLYQIEKQKTGKVIIRKKIRFFGLEVPMFFNKILNGDYEKNIQIDNINILGVNLPFTCYKEILSQLGNKEIKLTENEALEKARKDLENEEKGKFKNIKILDVKKEEKILNGKAIITGNYTCEENIAQIEKIILEK